MIPEDVRNLMTRVSQSGLIPLHQLSIKKARQEFDRRNLALELEPEYVAKTQDIILTTNNLRIRFYWSSDCTNEGFVLYVHGGGWVLGSIDGYDRLCRRLANRVRLPIASIDYALAPENPFPKPISDVMAAANAHKEIAELANVSGHVWTIMGDSAGANLAAAAVLNLPYESRPNHQALVYPVVDLSYQTRSRIVYGSGYLLDEPLMDWFTDHYLSGADLWNPHASLIYNTLLKQSPPTLIVTADLDPLHDEGVMYAKALRNSQVKVEHYNCRSLIHGFLNMPKALPKSSTVTDRICRWLRNSMTSTC